MYWCKKVAVFLPKVVYVHVYLCMCVCVYACESVLMCTSVLFLYMYKGVFVFVSNCVYRVLLSRYVDKWSMMLTYCHIYLLSQNSVYAVSERQLALTL